MIAAFAERCLTVSHRSLARFGSSKPSSADLVSAMLLIIRTKKENPLDSKAEFEKPPFAMTDRFALQIGRTGNSPFLPYQILITITAQNIDGRNSRD